MKKIFKNYKSFTLVELLLAVIILGFTLTGLLKVFIQCSVLSELARNKTVVMSEIQGKMEEIRNSDYSLIVTDYDEVPFYSSQLNATCVSLVDDTNAELLEIKIVASWKNKYGRVIGEDQNLDGDDESGAEDVDGDGEVSSIATLISKIAQRW